MPLRRMEIREFIKACEKIHALIAQGTVLTHDETALVLHCVDDLVSTLRPDHTAL
ncbi:MAG TPA: hypothetical protein VFS39_07550 [Nitrospira sp.]|nr:hypothetical protein [Nitrospira sp.]